MKATEILYELNERRSTHTWGNGIPRSSIDIYAKINKWPMVYDFEDMDGAHWPEWLDNPEAYKASRVEDYWDRHLTDYGGLLDWERQTFAEQVKEEYHWVKDVRFTGRSGGWVTLVLDYEWEPEGWYEHGCVLSRVYDGLSNYRYWLAVYKGIREIEQGVYDFINTWGDVEYNSEYWVEEWNSVIDWVEENARDELAVLSIVAHGKGGQDVQEE